MPISPGDSPPVRSPEDERIFEKSAKLKERFRNRVRELEEQNELLRLQNLRCVTQFNMLRSYTEKNQQLKQEMSMSRSITGTLPVGKGTDNRTSDDSGLTSDDAGSDRRNMSNSVSEATPRCTRRAGTRTRMDSATGPEGDKCSSTSDSSPFEEAKPVPLPRVPRRQNLMERDSLNSYAEDYEFDAEDEIFDEIESPKGSMCRSTSHNPRYMNLDDFVSVREDTNVYSDIIKTQTPIPTVASPRPWEAKLRRAAEKCLSITECNNEDVPTAASPYHVSRLSHVTSDSPVRLHSSGSKLSSPRVNSICSNPRVSDNAYAVRDVESGEYYIPPDATRLSTGGEERTSLISIDSVEKSGFWYLCADRSRSLKRRYVVLKHNQLSFFKKQKDEEACSTVPISEVQSVSKLMTSSGHAFQITMSGTTHKYSTDTEKSTQEWITVITSAMKGATLRELATKTTVHNGPICGWVTRVKCGHSKRMFASVIGKRIVFFKSPEDNYPSTFLNLQGAQISDKQANSSEEYSGSSDEQQQAEDFRPNQKGFSVSIAIANEDPVYIIVRSSEEKERWKYYLREASGHASMFGTPFEIFLQRLLADGAEPESELWKDILFVSVDENPKDTLTTVAPENHKKAIEIAQACYLFVSRMMAPNAFQIHVDLAQNILNTAVKCDYVRNELYAQLLKLTSGSMPFGLQGWKLLALCLPLFLPTQYAMQWVLKKHMIRTMDQDNDYGKMAEFCYGALERGIKMGPRVHGPSRLEATSILVRDPTATKFPHSISIRLPSQQYQVIEFDGSAQIGQCLSTLCLKLCMRPALLCGYALYMEDPLTNGLRLLKGHEKVCDVLSEWELKHRDAQRGRVSPDAVATLVFRMRHYWNHLVPSETPLETTFLVWRMAEEVVASRMPLSSELSEQIAALFAQVVYGNAPHSMNDEQFAFITQRCFPQKVLEVSNKKSLRMSIHAHWVDVRGASDMEAIRTFIEVLRKWPLFGADMYPAEAIAFRRTNDGETISGPVYIALLDSAIYLLDKSEFDIKRCIPFDRLTTFGAFHGGFMLTVNRILSHDAHPDESNKERITFSMEPAAIEELTQSLAEYIRCRKIVWKVSK